MGMLGGLSSHHMLAALPSPPNLSGILPSPTSTLGNAPSRSFPTGSCVNALLTSLLSTAGMLLHDFSPQNAGLFGHHPMLGGGMPGDFHDSKNSVLGLNLVPSDFSHASAGSVHPQQMQQPKDPYHVPTKQTDSPEKAAGNGPVGGGEPSGDTGAAPSDEVVCKVEKMAEAEQQQPQQDDARSNSDDTQAAKENEATTDKAAPESSPASPKRDSKQISQEDPAAHSNASKADDILDASPTKAAPASESRAPSTTSESQPSSSTESEKRPHSEVLGAASTSPHKRQRVVV
jgi:hypothetical protein